MFETLLRRMEERGVLTRNVAYEYAWNLSKDIPDVEFTALFKTFFEELRLRLGLNTAVKVPWKDLIRLMLRHDETPFKEQVKTLKAQYDTIVRIREWIVEK